MGSTWRNDRKRCLFDIVKELSGPLKGPEMVT